MPSTITTLISDDLRDRVRQSRPLPAPLSLSEIARHYRVSLTPVRQATQALIDEGVLTRGANGRLAVGAANPLPAPEQGVSDAASDAPTAAAEWENALIAEILTRSLHGDDEYLREEVCARRYGVGRTQLRSTFSRLSGQSLLVHVPRCGWRVRTFDEADLRAYLVAREALELTALEQSLPFLDHDILRAMRQGNQPESADAPAHLDNDLHRYLIETSGNRYIQEFFARHGLYYAALFDYAAPETQVVDAMARQHHAVLDALLCGDIAEARAALSEHIRAQYPIVKRLLANFAKETVPTEPPEKHAKTRKIA